MHPPSPQFNGWPIHGAAALYAALLYTLVAAVYRAAPEPYMDEPFHTGQTQRYCRGDFSYWDPKITTFPGLYIVGVAQALVSALVLKRRLPPPWDSVAELCSTQRLRLINVVLGIACLYVLHSILAWHQSSDQPANQQQQQQQQQQRQSKGAVRRAAPHRAQLGADTRGGGDLRLALWALALALMPLHHSYTFLYYTDVGATLFMLLCYREAHTGTPASAGLAAAACVLFRQTNAVWVAFTAGSVALQMVAPAVRQRAAARQQQQQQQLKAPRAKSGGAGHWARNLLWEVADTLAALWAARGQLVCQLWPLVSVVLLFVSFVLLNGGITVGDREAHRPVRHPAQLLLYFPLFAGAMLGPALLDPLRPALTAQRATPPWAWLGALALAAGAAAAGLALSPPPHPYLLADNRHYTFYLWRRVLARSGPLTYGVLVPLAGALWCALLAALLQRRHWLWVAGYVACTAAVLVPAWLLEFRYFSAPFMILALQLPVPRWVPLLSTLALYAAINAVTSYLFLQRPFAWADGSTARFMW